MFSKIIIASSIAAVSATIGGYSSYSSYSSKPLSSGNYFFGSNPNKYESSYYSSGTPSPSIFGSFSNSGFYDYPKSSYGTEEEIKSLVNAIRIDLEKYFCSRKGNCSTLSDLPRKVEDVQKSLSFDDKKDLASEFRQYKYGTKCSEMKAKLDSYGKSLVNKDIQIMAEKLCMAQKIAKESEYSFFENIFSYSPIRFNATSLPDQKLSEMCTGISDGLRIYERLNIGGFY